MIIDAVLIAGPTASGKTAAALAVAERIGGAIVNADSMQIYRELRVLTARPSDEEMARVPHHLFGHVSVHEHYSVGRYHADAPIALEQSRAAKRIPIFVGGTGLYFAALTDGLADIPPIPAAIRTKVRARLERVGNAAFHAELAARDPATATRLKPSDTQRILRAREVLEATGRPLASWQKRGRGVLDGMKLARFVLDVPREELRERVEIRFRAMLESGAREEAAALGDLDPTLPSAKILGLRELGAALRGELSEDAALAQAVTRTRQFAKRQDTWFRNRMADWTTIPAGEGSNKVSRIIEYLS
jgi:tRNA dimethylallyltransferase